MGDQIIKQPDGQFAVYSTETDTIITWDASADDLVAYYADKAREQARRRARETIDKVAAGNARDVYYQFVLTWEEALENDREHGGEAHDHFPGPDEDSGPMSDRPDWWTPGHEAAALEGVRDGIAARKSGRQP